MVNTGRPSPACKACSTRRLKCDQTRPACTKCIRYKRQCPGYREPSESNFRDQTQLIIEKHQSKQKSTSGEISGQFIKEFKGRLRLKKHQSNQSKIQSESLNALNLRLPAEQEAKSFFYTNFVEFKSSPVGGLKFLSPLVNSVSENSMFYSAFLATSMASLATRPNCSCLLPVTRLHYNRALQQMSNLVKNKDKLIEDETMAAIILLIFYESLMWEDNKPGGLAFHIRGAQALARLRGPQQRYRPVGYAMFEFIRTFMIHQYVYVPDYDAGELKWWASEETTDDPGHILQQLNVESVLLRRQIEHFIGSADEKSKSSIAYKFYQEAKKIDDRIGGHLNQVGGLWVRNIERLQIDIKDEDISEAISYPGKVYSFNNTWVGYHSLNAHIQRLKLAEVRAKLIEWIEEHRAPGVTTGLERVEAAAAAHEQISEIIAMVPFFLNWTNHKPQSPYSAMTCSFQLYVTGSSPFISKKQRKFIVGRLNAAAQITGLKLTRMFAKNLSCKATYST